MNDVQHEVESAPIQPTAPENQASAAGDLERSATETSPHLVNVAEAIRYRKRAQAAEQEASELRQRLDEVQQQSEAMQQRLTDVVRRAEVDVHLAQAGATDVEAARLLVEASLGEAEVADVSKVIDDVRRSRPHLFRSSASEASGSAMGPAVLQVDQATRDVDRAALAARRSGHTADVMHYMNLRRSALRS